MSARMKTNKSFTKRVKVTKSGLLKTRAPGFNHFNAKQSRSTQLNGKVENTFVMKNKAMGRFLPGLVK
jgi:ribosomal protein L35